MRNKIASPYFTYCNLLGSVAASSFTREISSLLSDLCTNHSEFSQARLRWRPDATESRENSFSSSPPQEQSVAQRGLKLYVAKQKLGPLICQWDGKGSWTVLDSYDCKSDATEG